MNWIRKIKSSWFLCGLLIVTGCASTPIALENPVIVDNSSLIEPLEVVSKGMILDTEAASALEQAHRELMIEYMNQSYQALSNLTTPQYETLFSTPEAFLMDAMQLNFQIDLRLSQPIDYRLSDYDFELEVIRVFEDEQKQLNVMLNEASVEKFVGLPEIESERYRRFHWFILEQQDAQWRIKEHISFDPAIMILLQEGIDLADLSSAQSWLSELKNQIIENQHALRAEQQTIELPAVDHSYQYELALDYAVQYIEERNEAWQDYSMSGGNCQNYVSQALLASGIPMDYTGSQIWKWHSDVVSNQSLAYGRSSSWTGVDEFMRYAQLNTGSGLSAITDAGFKNGRPGDLIHLAAANQWRHTVMISQPLLDNQGNVVDYLVYSNTQNLKDYPISLYGYSHYQLTVVVGWND